MTGKSGIHQPQTVQKFCSCSKCTADSRHSRSLVKCQCCRNMQHLIYLRLCSTSHSPSGIRGQRFQISSGTLRIEHTQSQRRFSRAGDTRDSHDLDSVEHPHLYFSDCAPSHPAPECRMVLLILLSLFSPVVLFVSQILFISSRIVTNKQSVTYSVPLTMYDISLTFL